MSNNKNFKKSTSLMPDKQICVVCTCHSWMIYSDILHDKIREMFIIV